MATTITRGVPRFATGRRTDVFSVLIVAVTALVVLGVWTDDGGARAYPLKALAKLDQPLADRLHGKGLSIHYDREAHSARVEQADDGVHWVYSFWFAWFAFHPKTDVFATAEDQ